MLALPDRRGLWLSLSLAAYIFVPRNKKSNLSMQAKARMEI
jgi:hypothetical protein